MKDFVVTDDAALGAAGDGSVNWKRKETLNFQS